MTSDKRSYVCLEITFIPKYRINMKTITDTAPMFLTTVLRMLTGKVAF